MKSRYSRRHHVKPLDMRSFVYKGFLVTLVNNKRYSFRYEWKLTPLSPKAKHLSRPQTVILDPTSSRRPESALYFAKCAVNEMKPTFWWINLS